LPYFDDKAEYNPFDALITISDINGTPCNITYDSNYVNAIKVTHLDPKTTLGLTTIDSDNTRYGIMVAGTKLTINLYSGLHSSTTQPHLIYDGPSTSIPSNLNVLTDSIVFKRRDTTGAIQFSITQFPADIGFPEGLAGYSEVYRTNDQTDYYNLDLSIGNPCWFNNNSPSTWFDAVADGIRPTLYTVRNLNDPDSKFNYRRVYQYKSAVSVKVDIQNFPTLQTLSLPFTIGRSYYDVEVIRPSFKTGENQNWNYMDLVSNTTIGNVSSIQWIEDTNFSEHVFTNWAFGNSVTATEMPIELFYAEYEQKKWVNIKLLPFQKLMNQFGLPIGGTSWDGSVYAPLVSTQVVSLNARLSSPVLDGSTYQMEQYSIAANTPK
jgi:hypothetical protein